LIEFLKFYNREYDDFGSHIFVSTRIELPEANWKEVEKALKKIGIIFRRPNR